jgi:hypothetical protein
MGHATSLDHMAPRDTCMHIPAINYVRGRIITVTFDSAKVKNVIVKDSLAGGMYIEPDADSTCAQLAKKAPAGATPATRAATGTVRPTAGSTPPGQVPLPTSPPSPVSTPAVPAPATPPPSKRP